LVCPVGDGAGVAGFLAAFFVALVGCWGSAWVGGFGLGAGGFTRLAGLVFAFVASAGLCGAAWRRFAAAYRGHVVGGAVCGCPGSLVFTVRCGARRTPAPAFVGGSGSTRLHGPLCGCARLTGFTPAPMPGLS